MLDRFLHIGVLSVVTGSSVRSEGEGLVMDTESVKNEEMREVEAGSSGEQRPLREGSCGEQSFLDVRTLKVKTKQTYQKTPTDISHG